MVAYNFLGHLMCDNRESNTADNVLSWILRAAKRGCHWAHYFICKFSFYMGSYLFVAYLCFGFARKYTTKKFRNVLILKYRG